MMAYVHMQAIIMTFVFKYFILEIIFNFYLEMYLVCKKYFWKIAVQIIAS